jgi:hypothetical protein
MELHIDKELEEFIPPLTEKEFSSLSLSIKANGCQDNIKVWHHSDSSLDTIVDGHNRYKICQQLKIPFKITRMKFADKSDAITWMFNKQGSRRNLNTAQLLELHSKLQEYLEKFAKERMLAGEKIENAKNETLVPRGTKGKSSKKLSQTIGTVSERTIDRFNIIKKKGTEEQKADLRAGKKKIGTVYNEIKAKEKPKQPKAPKGVATNENEIEKLLKGKDINTPYLILYSKKDKDTGEEMRACLSNCEPKANLMTCRDYIMETSHGNCPEDDFVQFRISARRMIDGVVFKEVANAQD